jgi:predicted methyltransferase
MIARSLGDAASTTDAAFGSFEIRTQDCIEFLRDLPDESVDLIVTDPAYSGMNQHMRFGHGRIVGHYGRMVGHYGRIVATRTPPIPYSWT